MNSILSRTTINELRVIGNWQNVTQHFKKVCPVVSTKNFHSLVYGDRTPVNSFLNHGNSIHINTYRHYAKGKDKKKEKGKTKVVINEVQIAQLLNLDSIKTQMSNSIEHLKEDFIKHLSLRSAAGSIESILVTLDGEEHTLQELAQISRKNPKTVIISMATFPQAIPEVLKAIEKSGLNLNPQQDGTTLFIPIPKVTKEHRENLSKNAKQLFVKCRDHIRDVQNKYSKSMQKKDAVSEDLVRSVDQQLKALADQYIGEAEKILESKQKELLGN